MWDQLDDARTAAAPQLGLSYVLPIRRSDGSGSPDEELTGYLTSLAPLVEVIVVDGSPQAEFDAAHQVWGPLIRHVRPSAHSCLNGKVRGVLSGLEMAVHDRVVIADDDVRHDAGTLSRMADLLQQHDLVVPQNYFDPCPWHAKWDGARTLVNRAFGHDFPGTLGVRREVLRTTSGYDGDVLFENLELIRTVRSVSDRTTAPLDLYVRRLPPTTSKFLEQRVRQAYDDFARPGRFVVGLAVLPAVVWSASRGPKVLVAMIAAELAVSEAGRRRAGGTARFSLSMTLLSPLWWLERSVCSWASLLLRARGGVPYAGRRLRVAAHSQRALRPARRDERWSSLSDHFGRG